MEPSQLVATTIHKEIQKSQAFNTFLVRIPGADEGPYIVVVVVCSGQSITSYLLNIRPYSCDNMKTWSQEQRWSNPLTKWSFAVFL